MANGKVLRTILLREGREEDVGMRCEVRLVR